MEIKLNGVSHQINDPQTLHELIVVLGLSGQALAAAVNHEVVPQKLWSQRALLARDTVDIVRAIGGG